jgi:vacuolar-type H+-ATPase catalytic subunit A/Vma1
MGCRILEWLLQTVYENSLIEHHIGLPPSSMGKITYIALEGQYTLQVQLWIQNAKSSVLCAHVFIYSLQLMVS